MHYICQIKIEFFSEFPSEPPAVMEGVIVWPELPASEYFSHPEGIPYCHVLFVSFAMKCPLHHCRNSGMTNSLLPIAHCL